MDRGASREKDWDRLAVLLVVVFTSLGLVLGLSASGGTVDVDQVVYEDTLDAMHGGDGYYAAMREALVAKEGSGPSQVRSVRPPSLFLVLRPFPEGSWRWFSAAAQAASLVLGWRIGRSRWPTGGPIAVALIGFWMLGAAPLLYLHAELWGLPLALAGVLAMRRERWGWAAVAFAAATCVRELFVVFLVLGLALVPRRRSAWASSLAVVGVALAVHWWQASGVLDPRGHEAAFGKDRGVVVALSSLSPADRPFAWVVGVGGTVCGLWVLVRLARSSDGACERVVLGATAVLIVVTVVFGRAYWGLTFGPVLACYASMAPDEWRVRQRSRHAPENGRVL